MRLPISWLIYYHDGSKVYVERMEQNKYFDVLIVGSGVAGLTLALSIEESYRIAIISKSTLQGGASWLAQGGIAAVLDKNDTKEAHVRDTEIAGAGLCHSDTVRFVVEMGRTLLNGL